MFISTVGNFEQLDIWLKSCGFNPDNPVDIYCEIKKVLTSHSKYSFKDLEGKGIRFHEGAVQIVDGAEGFDKIQLVMEKILKVPEISFKERMEIFKQAKRFCTVQNFTLQEPSAVIHVVDSMGVKGDKEVLFSTYGEIPYFQNLIWSKLEELDQQSPRRGFVVNLPESISIADFIDYIDYRKSDRAYYYKLMPTENKSQELYKLIAQIRLGEYFDDREAIKIYLKELTALLQPIDLELIRGIESYFCLFSNKLAGDIYSPLVSSYITSSLANGESMKTICRNLNNETTDSLPISLNLQGVKLTADDLRCLNQTFSNVYSLDLTGAVIAELPRVWVQSLRYLDISSTEIPAIPSGFTVLERFTANHAEELADIRGLSGLQKLEEIDISGTLVRVAPEGCSSLKAFRSSGDHDLVNINGLNDLKHLEVLILLETNVRQAPKGCLSLQFFNAARSTYLDDVSRLDGLERLKMLVLHCTSVGRLPINCPALSWVDIGYCNRIQNIDSLDGSQELESLNIEGLTLARKPQNCPRLLTIID